MILRRVINHFRKQEWTAIGIDFVIVVFGVFFGIQVANWNADRLDAVRAHAYLARIRDNLRTDLNAMTQREAFWRQVNDYGNDAVRHAETGELVDGSAWKTVLAFYQASQVWLYASDDTTYQEMRNGGELALIRNEDLRVALSGYYRESSSDDTDYVLGMIPVYRKLVRGLSPSVVATQIWAHCHRQLEFGNQALLDCPSPMPESDAQAVLAAYLREPQLLPELRFWISNQSVAAKIIAANRAATEVMLTRVESELKP